MPEVDENGLYDGRFTVDPTDAEAVARQFLDDDDDEESPLGEDILLGDSGMTREEFDAIEIPELDPVRERKFLAEFFASF